jgi:hypothetical protein
MINYKDVDRSAKLIADDYVTKTFNENYVTRQVTYDDVWEDFLGYIVDIIGKPYNMDYEQVYDDDKMSDICFKYTKYVVYRFVLTLRSITGVEYEFPYEINPNDYVK